MSPQLRFLSAAFLLCWFGLACAPDPDAPPPVVDPTSERLLPAGAVVGFASESGSHVWRGIPYAKPPVGDLRWRAPEPLPVWEGTREALAHGSACVQYPMPMLSSEDPSKVIGSEDCLVLNVFAPEQGPDEVPQADGRRPVMVWIHGGANLTGEAASYDWSLFAAKHNVVVLAMNYRLGAFGWFRHPSLWEEAGAEGSTDDAFDRSGNFGTLDLIRALEWTRDNVSGFGGDPGNVTIFGESAGGNNVIALLLSPPARGLFHRAISQSGGTWSTSVAGAENWTEDEEPGRAFSSREFIAKLVQSDGTVDTREAAKDYVDRADRDQLGRYLRSKTAAEVMEVVSDRKKVSMSSMPLTIRGGTVVAEGEMLDSFERGDYHHVPTVLGTNRDESNLFMMWNPEYTYKLFGVLPRIRDVEIYKRDSEYAGKAWKADGADQIAIAMAEHQPGSVYGYRFHWDDEPRMYGTDFSTLIGAAHGIEIPFVLGTAALGPLMDILGGDATRAQRQPLIDAMGSYWSQFAASGAPGRGSDPSLSLPEWKPWDSSSETSPRFILLDSENDGGLRMSADYVTAQRISDQILADARFNSVEDRCDALAYLVETFPRYTESDRLKAGCSAVAADGD